MSKIKIISNPYKKEIKYQKWNADDTKWDDINYDNNRNSQLLRNDLTGGFFPFKAKTIVDLLIKEYWIAECGILEIVFEGSVDEYRELESVCAYDEYADKVTINQSNIILENARDILPAVKKLFQNMSPLIVKSVDQDKIKRDLNRFTDASSDVVPICVLGNYSAGKSTFINALIGSEILPSGIEPVTAKVYKISRSKYQDRAYVKCQYLGFDVAIQFTEKESKFDAGIVENVLTKKIAESLVGIENESIARRVNTVLTVINDYENETEQTEISDLIEVEIPFINGVLAQTQHPFVIFDTPGSNSASNARHLMVLKAAMANMTNGLPIFLSTPDSLDSTDNENLYHIIRSMDELDSRFTMIVVNKADSAGIQRRGATEIEQNRVLSQAVPKNLYSGGLFYVSSIIGLGSKTGGQFADYVYEDIFDAQEERYADPNNKHYRTLYLFNVQPMQLKLKADTLAAEQSDLLYANSGLFTVETEIEEFAGKYSAYNKCFQSQMFLTRVIEITRNEIEEKKHECEEIRLNIKEKLEADKKALIEKLDSTTSTEREHYVGDYQGFMQEFLNYADKTFSVQDLKSQEETFTQVHEESLNFSGRSDDVKNAKTSMASNFKQNVFNAFKERKTSAFKEIVGDLKADYVATRNTYQAKKDARHQADKQTSDSLLKYVTEEYEKKLADIYSLLDSKSKEYWTDRTEQLRETLATIVAGSEVLTDARRKELERIIITYRQITFTEESAETIFDRVNFERRISIAGHVLWESDHLNIDKLTKTYNTSIMQGAKARYDSIEVSHRESAFSWIQDLLNEIYENIVEYSPELSKQAKQIKVMTDQIEELENNQAELHQYTEQLRQMMEWKVIE
ncbi:dynamin family protein [Ruminococcus flavefaciens]|uniref:dynamin family protein n=1 Tax=Ruminococcus flavefaciens TaxID=1265 RepID=UPI0002FF0001|nr:dynamin family protein [Ruminococcus flavefaciens]